MVDAAYHMAGSTRRVQRQNAFERRFRDMHAIAQQLQARDTHYETVGLAMLNATPELKRLASSGPQTLILRSARR